MKKFFASLVAILAIGIAANAASYTIDESAIDAAIEAAVAEAPAQSAGVLYNSVKIGAQPQPIIATVLSIIPVTSWLALHRAYLGTSWLAVGLNILTGAGFGIVYVVDAVVLVLGTLDNNIGAYVNNPRWLMWANII